MEKTYPPIFGKKRNRTNNFQSKRAHRHRIVAFVWATFYAFPLIACFLFAFLSRE